MPPFLGLTRTRSFSFLHPLFRIYTQDQPQRHVVAICQLHNYIRDLPRIAFRTPFKATQHLEHRTDRGLVVRQQVRRILTGAPCPVGSNTSRLQCADLDPERRNFHRQCVAETAHSPLGRVIRRIARNPRGDHRPKIPERCDRSSACASLALLTRTSSRPKVSTANCTAAFAATSSRTSSVTGFTRSPYCATRGASSSVRRAPATTLSPAASAASAMSRPNPFPLPVINQTFDMRFSILFVDRLCGHRLNDPLSSKPNARVGVLSGGFSGYGSKFLA